MSRIMVYQWTCITLKTAVTTACKGENPSRVAPGCGVPMQTCPAEGTAVLHPPVQHFRHSTTCNHPKADISQFKILDQDRKQVSREAIHIRRNNPTLNYNIGEMNIPKIFNQALNTDNNSSAEDSTNSNNQPNATANSSNRATRTTISFN